MTASGMDSVDVFVIGSGPAGQKAAIQAAKAGRSVVLCEQLREVGGACVQFGTIPSKALREAALRHSIARRVQPTTAAPVGIRELLGETDALIRSHDEYMRAQLERNRIRIVHGRASYRSAREIEVRSIAGEVEVFDCAASVIATGSRPRAPEHVAIDHEFVFDSDSILSLGYLPETMLVLGGGVIACEYASVFALLGVKVLQLDRFPMPLGFLEPELVSRFRSRFEDLGGEFRGPVDVVGLAPDGAGGVVATLSDGEQLTADKGFCALGRVSEVRGLQLERAGLETDERGLIPVDARGQTAVPTIYAAGDVVGPPSLASSSMEQGRRAARALLGLDLGSGWQYTPVGIYSIPGIGSVGLTEAQARGQYEQVFVGQADYAEIARGLLDLSESGMLKLVADGDGRLLGAHAIGGPASELVHLAQLALIHEAKVDLFVDHVFNFPTYAETYRVAALAILAQRDQRPG